MPDMTPMKESESCKQSVARDDIEVAVMAVNGYQVRIGIKAPRDVIVDRQEVAQRKQRECSLRGPSERTAAAFGVDASVTKGGPIRTDGLPLGREAAPSDLVPLAVPPPGQQGKKTTLRIGKS